MVGPAPAIPRIALQERVPAEVSVVMPGGGRIAFHRSKEAFEAHCSNPAHGHCRLTRTVKGRERKGVGTVAGRPLGFLYCWLNRGHVATKEEHWHKGSWFEWFTREERRAARAALKDVPGSAPLFEVERAKEPGESSEPETLVGMLG